jgi:hypothetical protein
MAMGESAHTVFKGLYVTQKVLKLKKSAKNTYSMENVF